jgi:hypothetical protein
LEPNFSRYNGLERNPANIDIFAAVAAGCRPEAGFAGVDCAISTKNRALAEFLHAKRDAHSQSLQWNTTAPPARLLSHAAIPDRRDPSMDPQLLRHRPDRPGSFLVFPPYLLE